jgi:hypothetical protein
VGQSEGSEPVGWKLWELRPYERSRCAEHMGAMCRYVRAVRAPPEIVMVAPPEVPRNAERAQSEGHA